MFTMKLFFANFSCFYLVFLIFHTSNAKTIDEFVAEANKTTITATEIKNAVKVVSDSVAEYQKKVDPLKTTPADIAAAQTAKTAATSVIEEGKNLTQKAFDAQYLAEDAKMDVAALLQAITDAKGKTTSVDSKLTEAENTAKAAQQNITAELDAVRGHVGTFQKATQEARKGFYAADLIVDSGPAVNQLTKDVEKLKKDSDMTAKKARDAKVKSNAALLAANALTASDTQEKLAEAKESCVKALKTARELEISAEGLRFHATVISEASEKAEIAVTPEPASSESPPLERKKRAPEEAASVDAPLEEARKAKAAADTTMKELTALLNSDISLALRDAKAGRIKAAELLAESDKNSPTTETKDADETLIKQQKMIEDFERRAEKAEEENRRLTQEKQDAEKQAANEVKMPLDENRNPINIAHYMDEKYEQPDNNEDHGQNCESMADLCGNAIYADMMRVYCKGTCR